jgi:hypothetical protein
MISYENRCGWVGWAGCGIPSTSLRATTRTPARKIVGDPAATLRSLVEIEGNEKQGQALAVR